MTGRIFKRNILEVRGVSQSVLQNHPLPDSADDPIAISDVSSEESTVYGNVTPLSINWSSDQDKTDDSLWSGKHKNATFCEGSWSETTERTISSCSWGDDDFEKETTNRVQEMLNAIDEALYEGVKPSKINQELYEDCQEWRKRYPYLRLLGHQLVEPVDDSVVFYPTMLQQPVVENLEYFKDESPDNLCLVGKEVNIYPLPVGNGEDDRSYKHHSEETGSSQCIEETLVEDEGYEELLAYDNSDSTTNSKKGRNKESTASQKFSPTEIEVIKDKVIDRLMEIVWPEVMNFWQAFEDSQEYDRRSLDSREGRFLPPLETDQPRSFSQLRPRSSQTLRRSALPSSADSSNLEGILTVSSKVLQSRKDFKSSTESGICTRPGSSLITLSRTSVSNHSPVPPSSQQSQSKPAVQVIGTSSIPGSRATSAARHRGGHVPPLHMPVVEEDVSSLPNILYGIRLGPEVDQPLSLDGNMTMISQVSGKHYRAPFLPPINNSELVPKSKQIIRSPPPPLQSSTSLFEKNQANVFGRYLTVSDSRPSTSKSYRGITGHASLKQKSPSPVNRDLHPLPAVNHRGTTPSPQKIVTLFPLVTPLDPGRYLGEPDRVKSWRNPRRTGQSGISGGKITRR